MIRAGTTARSGGFAWSALFAFALLLLIPSPAWAAITLVQDVFVQSLAATDETTRTATFASNVTAGNVLIATITGSTDATLTGVTGGGVAWTQAVTVQVPGAQRLWIYYGTNSSGGAKTITLEGTAGRWTLQVAEWSGLDTSGPLEASTSRTGTSAFPETGSITTTSPAVLLIALESDSTNLSAGTSSNAGFTILQGGSATYGQALYSNQSHNPAYRLVTGAGSFRAQWLTNNSSTVYGAAIAVFRADSSVITSPGSGAVTTTTSANPSCAQPAEIQANDIGIWHAISVDNATHSYPSGWTKVTQVNQTSAFTHSWAWKRFAGNESGNVTVTIAGNKNKQCKISVWRGVRTAGDPYRAYTANQGSNSNVFSVDPLPVSAAPSDVIVVLLGLSGGSAGVLSGGSGVAPAIEAYRHFVGGGTKLTIALNYAPAALTAPGSADLGSVGVAGADYVAYQMALIPQCPVVSDPTYVVTNARSGQVKVYWSSSNPVVILRKTNAAFDSETPGSPGAATLVYSGSTSPFTDPVSNGNAYSYMVFTNASGCYSSGTEITASPDSASPQWSYGTTAATMAPVALDPWSDKIVAGANDDKVHGKSAADGTLVFAPFTAGGPIQSRPAVIPAAFRTPTSAVSVAYVTSQDGYLYAVNSSTGAELFKAGVSCPSPCSPLGSMLQGGAAVWLQALAPLTFTGGVTADVVIVATRNTGTSSDTNNKVYAVNGSTGAIVWTFAPGNMDIVASTPYLDYSRNTVWVTSRSSSGTQSSLWKLDAATGALAAGTSTWSFGDIDSSPIASADGTLLYVGTNAGDLKAIRVVDRDSQLAGTSVSHTPAGGTGAVRGMPWWLSWDAVSAATPDTIIFVRDLTVHSVNFDGTAFSSNWTQTLTWTPSSPVDDAAGNLYVGGSDGKVHRLSVSAGTDLAQVPATAISGTLGEPSINWDRGVIHVGGSDGHIYTFAVGF